MLSCSFATEQALIERNDVCLIVTIPRIDASRLRISPQIHRRSQVHAS
jgi:hypothetical protein